MTTALSQDQTRTVMTPEEFAEKMKRIAASKRNYFGRSMYDREPQRKHAVELMTALLATLGYNEGVDVFLEMSKDLR